MHRPCTATGADPEMCLAEWGVQFRDAPSVLPRMHRGAESWLDVFLPDWARGEGPRAAARYRMIVAFALLIQPVLLFFGTWIAVVPELPWAAAAPLGLSVLLLIGLAAFRHAPFRFPLEGFVAAAVFVVWVALSIFRGGFPYFVFAWGAILPLGFALLGRPRFALFLSVAMIGWAFALYGANLTGLAMPPRQAPGEVLHRDVLSAALLMAVVTLFGIAHARANQRAEGVRRELEEGLRRSQRLESLGRLAGSMAHEFNNLLAAVGASAESLSQASDREAREEAGHIQQVVRRGSLLTRQLLAFGRSDGSVPESLELNDTIRHVLPLIERAAGGDTTLELRLDPEPLWIRADAMGIEQVLMNLVINARDAMGGGGRVVVETGRARPAEEGWLATHGTEVVLQVHDQGTGMSPEILDQAFEPFFTTKARNEGTGLGLSTVARIVDDVGGRVGARSEPGRGTTVVARFPEAEPVPVSQRAERSERAPAPAAGRVLLVEDDERLRRAFHRILDKRGYEVHVAADGGEALEVWDRLGGDVRAVVTDVLMPGMGGRELALELRRRVPGLPVVFISGYSEGPLAMENELPCCTRFLAKPFRAQALIDELAELHQSVTEEGLPCRAGRAAPDRPDSERTAHPDESGRPASVSSPPV